jgi:UDP-glucose 4-epimerase
VSDLARAHVVAVDWLAQGKPSQAFNLGIGRGFSVADVARTAEAITSKAIATELLRDD